MRWDIRRVLTLAVVGLTGAPCAVAQVPDDRVKPAQAGGDPAAARIAPTANPGRMARLLQLWERQSARLKTLDVKIERTDKNPAWGEDEHYVGRALLMSPDLAWLDFQKVAFKGGKPVLDKDGKPMLTPWERIISTGEEVWQYRNETKQIFIYPLEKQPQKRALEEGPLPFLFNFREADARQRYEMSLMEENDKHYWIGIRPKLVMDQDAFKQAFVKLDKEVLLPVRIYLLAPDGKSTKNFTLKREEMRLNKEIPPQNFRGQVMAGWKVIDNREGEGVPARGRPEPAAAPAPASGRPARPSQPAMRTGVLGGRRD
ncbi:MAG TPA: outer-membrane lipoprotein carrier protein LolA [Isosphaeraceae bacterium]|nr:outer-membrane lipoprotein carrier protein LolA [Isosphaeraceae bacterium]